MLAADVPQIERRGGAQIDRRRCTGGQPLAAKRSACLEQMIDGEHRLRPDGDARLARIRARDEYVVPRLASLHGGEKQPLHGLERTAQAQLAVELAARE